MNRKITISCEQDTNKIASANQAKIRIQLNDTTNLSNFESRVNSFDVKYSEYARYCLL